MAKKSLNRLFGLAAQKKANKLIISPLENEVTCTYKLPFGEESYFKLPKKLETELSENLRSLLKIAPEELMNGKYCKLRNKNFNLNFYLSIIPDRFGEKIIITILKNDHKLFTINKLGLEPNQKDFLKKTIAMKSGLVVISSNERQGRSSTLFSLLSDIEKEKRAAYFLGKYPDLEIEGVNYLGEENINWDWVLKHDTDILALDSENEKDWQQAIIAASTGRLVIMTIQAINSFEALYKLLSLNLPKKLILDSLKLITSQTLKPLNRPPQKSKSKNKIKRDKIAHFEFLILNKRSKKYITENLSSLKTKDFWKKLITLIKELE